MARVQGVAQAVGGMQWTLAQGWRAGWAEAVRLCPMCTSAAVRL